jgi:hypothetical protein
VASFLTVSSGGGIAIEELEIDPAQDRLLDRDGRDCERPDRVGDLSDSECCARAA